MHYLCLVCWKLKEEVVCKDLGVRAKSKLKQTRSIPWRVPGKPNHPRHTMRFSKFSIVVSHFNMMPLARELVCTSAYAEDVS
uniref:Uncharacterized protein n=1 Tax=Anguilla anguilla TaxID=7936 RepID=A0A0E9X3N0_ANGAN